MARRRRRSNYGQQRANWTERLLGDDRNSVYQQLLRMMWDLAVFQMVQEAVRLGSVAEDGRPAVNLTVLNLLATSFYERFLFFIRRLVDTDASTTSLTRILEEMEGNAHHMTREAIFAAEGLAYDYEPILEAERRWSAEQVAKGITTFAVPQEFNGDLLEDRHEMIDRLTGVSPSNRRTSDAIRSSLFQTLKNKLVRMTTPVKIHVNNFLAHSANPGNRPVLDPTVSATTADDIVITFAELRSTLQCFCEITSFLAVNVLGGSVGPWLAFPQYDQFEHIEKPIAELDALPALRQRWNEISDESHTWSSWSINEYEAEYGPLT